MPLSAQQADSGAFFIRLGKDTLAVERYVRTDHQLISEVAYRVPETRFHKLTITYKDDGNVSWYEALSNPVQGVPKAGPIARTVVTYVGDSAQVQTWVAAVPKPPRSIGARADMVPLVIPFYSTFESALQKAKKAGGDSSFIQVLSGSGPMPYTVHWLRNDSLILMMPGSGPVIARLDKKGHLVSFNGQETTFKVNVTRAKWLDLAPYLKRFAAADSVGKPVGMLSPRDTIDESIGATAVLLDYGRPSMRGRKIFGHVVPWGQVWRTGANAATQIDFTTDVEINGVAVPKGKYTLWTIPEQKQWQLIVNKQTGQWGTIYDPKQDLARFPLTTEKLLKPVETFTMSIKPNTDGTGVLTMSWETTKVVATIKSKATAQ